MLTSGAFGYLADYVLWWVLYLSLIVHTWCFFRVFPRSTRRRVRLMMGNILVFLCFLSTAGIIGESYFRFLAVHTDPFGVSLPARRWFALYTDLNSLGCRDKEWSPEKASGVHRIAFVGDSFTYGWGVEEPADRFTDRIQREFDRAAAAGFEVMNVAKPGWSTMDELRFVPDFVKRYGVDEVVLCYVINDIEELIPVSADFNPTRPPEPVLFNPDSSCLLDYLYRRIYVPRAPTVRGYFDWLVRAYEDPSIWSAQQNDLRAMADACRRAGATFRVVLLPYVQSSENAARRDRIHAQLIRFFQAEGIEALDLAPAVAGQSPRSLIVSALDAHPNAKAHAIFAQSIWRSFYQDPHP